MLKRINKTYLFLHPQPMFPYHLPLVIIYLKVTQAASLVKPIIDIFLWTVY